MYVLLLMPGIKELMEAIVTDKNLASKLSQCSTPDDAVLLAKEFGYEISAQELIEGYKVHMATMSSDELSNVAGGKTYKKYYNDGEQQDGSNDQENQ